MVDIALPDFPRRVLAVVYALTYEGRPLVERAPGTFETLIEWRAARHVNLRDGSYLCGFSVPSPLIVVELTEDPEKTGLGIADGSVRGALKELCQRSLLKEERVGGVIVGSYRRPDGRIVSVEVHEADDKEIARWRETRAIQGRRVPDARPHNYYCVLLDEEPVARFHIPSSGFDLWPLATAFSMTPTGTKMMLEAASDRCAAGAACRTGGVAENEGPPMEIPSADTSGGLQQEKGAGNPPSRLDLNDKPLAPTPVSEVEPVSVATVSATEHDSEASTRTTDAAPGEVAHQPREQGAAPDATGYVVHPSDAASYVPMADILNHYPPADTVLTQRELTWILEDFATNRVRWTRPVGKDGKPRSNRRSVHLADWHTYLKRRCPADVDGWPKVSEREITEGAAAIREQNSHGK